MTDPVPGPQCQSNRGRTAVNLRSLESITNKFITFDQKCKDGTR